MDNRMRLSGSRWYDLPLTAEIDVESLTALIDCIDHAQFDERLLALANSVTPVEEIHGTLLHPNGAHPNGAHSGGAHSGGAAEIVGWCGRRGDARRRISAYHDDLYRRDPLVQTLDRHDFQRMRIAHTRASDIEDSDLRWTCFDEPGFGSRVVLARRLDHALALFSFYLVPEAIDVTTIGRLATLAALAWPVIRRHAFVNEEVHINARPRTDERLEARLETRFPALTPQERRVCALTMLGMTAEAIGKTMTIGTSTVLTYRRRAYKRLGITSAYSLIGELI